MSQQGNTLEVIDKFGWRKHYPLPTTPIIHLGSAAENNIVLLDEHGGGVLEIHAQIIAPTTHHAGYQLVNLSDNPIVLGQSGGGLPARSSIDIGEGSTFQLGDFTIIFHGEANFYGGPSLGSSRNIGVSIALSHTTLAPNEAIEGTVTISNIGELTGVQFDISLEGLSTNCFDLEPGPLLSSGAETKVALRIFHRGALPAAGHNQFSIRVVAPNSYPGEQVVLSQMIEVLPMYRHKLGLLIGKTDNLPQLDETEKLTPKKATKTGSRPTASTPVTATPDNWWGAAAAAAPQPARRYQPPPPQTDDWGATFPAAGPPGEAPQNEAATWFSTPAPAPAAPAPPSPQEAEAANWWAAPPEESPATTSPAAASTIPPATHVPRQVDDWFAAPDDATETGSAGSPPAIPAAADVPRQADDWVAPLPEPELPSAEPPIAAEPITAKPETPPAVNAAEVAPVIAPPPATHEPDPAPVEDDNLWEKTKKWSIGLAMALPFAKPSPPADEAPLPAIAPPAAEPVEVAPPEPAPDTRPIEQTTAFPVIAPKAEAAAEATLPAITLPTAQPVNVAPPEPALPSPVDAAAGNKFEDEWDINWETPPTAAPVAPAATAQPTPTADSAADDDWWSPAATPDLPEPELSAADEPEMPSAPATSKISDSGQPSEPGSQGGQKTAWQPLRRGETQINPEDWWHDDSDFDGTQQSNEATRDP